MDVCNRHYCTVAYSNYCATVIQKCIQYDDQFHPSRDPEPRTKDGSTVRYGTLVRYGMPQFLLRSTVRWYGTPFL